MTAYIFSDPSLIQVENRWLDQSVAVALALSDCSVPDVPVGSEESSSEVSWLGPLLLC